MATPIPNLWPEDLAPTTDVLSPLEILQSQVEQFTRRMQGLIQAEIISTENQGPGNVSLTTHFLDLVIPGLGNYRYRVLAATHRSDLVYPVVMGDDGDFFAYEGPPRLPDPYKFMEEVGKGLRSTQTRSVINSVLAKLGEQERRKGA